MKRAELIIFRFAVLAAACWVLFFVFFAFVEPSNQGMIILMGCLGAAGIMAVFYAIRWAVTGKILPWVPEGQKNDS